MPTKKNTQHPFNDYVKQVVELFVQELKKGTAPWQKSWSIQGVESLRPHSAVTGKNYRGFNSVFLNLVQNLYGYEDSRWLTFRQAQELGGHVKKGEKGTQCIFWKIIEDDDEGELASQEKKGLEPSRRIIPCPFTVFNVEQCEGLRLKKIVVQEHTWKPVEAAERLLKGSKAKIEELPQPEAYYSVAQDKIVLPARGQFNRAEDFYDVCLHELGHWTGHKSRLNRDMGGSFGSISYAKEELRAEIASFMLSSSLGISHDVKSHASYVDNWIQILQKDPKELFRACSDAEKIKDYLFNLDKSLGLSEPQTEVKMNSVSSETEYQNAAQQFSTLCESDRKAVVKIVAQSLKLTKDLNPYQMDLFEEKAQSSIVKGEER